MKVKFSILGHLVPTCHDFRSQTIAFFIVDFFLAITDLVHSLYICLIMVQALEEVEKNFATLRVMLSGDGEVEPNADQVSQLTLEICKEDVLALLIHKLPILKWEVSGHNS